MDMWRGGYFSEHVLLWAESPPFFSGAKKKQKNDNGANGHFMLCEAKSQKPPNGDRGNY